MKKKKKKKRTSGDVDVMSKARGVLFDLISFFFFFSSSLPLMTERVMPEPPPAAAAAAETIVQVHDDAPEAKTTEPVTLTWENVSYTIRTGKEPQSKTLLKNVSGFVAPGNVVAIMGASGAGN
jgi:ABC-type multidrug transport system fused ATPase/permease subunit